MHLTRITTAKKVGFRPAKLHRQKQRPKQASTYLKQKSSFFMAALSLGALMNTRGLMELVVLNIGYDLRILPPRIFTMMVLMALVTTFFTGPLLTLFQHGCVQRK